METLGEKVSFLKGLCEGLDIDTEKGEGKIISKIIEVLGEIASEIEFIEDDNDELQAQIDEIDEDLANVEDYLFCDNEDEFDDYDCEEIECPNCGELIFLDTDLLDDEEEAIVCPNCGEKVDVEFECDCCDCEDCE